MMIPRIRLATLGTGTEHRLSTAWTNFHPRPTTPHSIFLTYLLQITPYTSGHNSELDVWPILRSKPREAHIGGASTHEAVPSSGIGVWALSNVSLHRRQYPSKTTLTDTLEHHAECRLLRQNIAVCDARVLHQEPTWHSITTIVGADLPFNEEILRL